MSSINGNPVNTPSPSRPRLSSPPTSARGTFEQIVGALTLCAGALTLVGWVMGSQGLAALGFEGKPMVAHSALALILSGAALLLLNATRQSLRTAAQASILALGAIALANLVELGTGWNLGIDELLFPDPYNLPPLAPGRMAPNAAAGFVLTAAALWLMHRPGELGRRRTRILGGLGLAIMTLGTAALLGYLSGFQGFYGWWQLKAMPVPVALLLTLLGGAVLSFTLGETRMRWLLGRRLIGGFGLGLALITATVVYLRTTTEKLAEANAGVAQALNVLPKIHLLADKLEIENRSLQDYLLTDTVILRDRTTHDLATIRSILTELRFMTATNPDLRLLLERTGHLINDYEVFIRQVISARQSGGSSARAGPDLIARATAMNDQIRAQLDAIIAYKVELIASREATAARLSERAASILPIEILLMTLLTLAAVLLLNTEAAKQARSVEKLRRSEELKASILSSMPAEIALLNSSGDIVEVNEPWLRFAREHGAPAEHLIGVGTNYLEACRQAVTVKAPYAAEALTGIHAVLAGTRAEFRLEYPCPSPTQSNPVQLVPAPRHADPRKGRGGARRPPGHHRDQRSRVKDPYVQR